VRADRRPRQPGAGADTAARILGAWIRPHRGLNRSRSIPPSAILASIAIPRLCTIKQQPISRCKRGAAKMADRGTRYSVNCRYLVNLFGHGPADSIAPAARPRCGHQARRAWRYCTTSRLRKDNGPTPARTLQVRPLRFELAHHSRQPARSLSPAPRNWSRLPVRKHPQPSPNSPALSFSRSRRSPATSDVEPIANVTRRLRQHAQHSGESASMPLGRSTTYAPSARRTPQSGKKNAETAGSAKKMVDGILVRIPSVTG